MTETGNKDLKTEAIVLRRTNYGETDRVLTILTPEGKKSVLAKGVRKERSKLAGGIEMFCRSEVVLHQGRGELLILISAKMKEFYKNILADFEVLEIASQMLKKISKAAEGADNSEHYQIIKACLMALDKKADIDTIISWFYFNVARTSGEQVNLYYDADGEKLAEDKRYDWDAQEKVLRPAEQGKIGAAEIKMMRLMLSAGLELVLRVKGAEGMIPEILWVAKTLSV